ncbi:ethanolamine utilization protein EutH [Neisseria sp. Ec49-e6-T10]|uniref:ethanolamine utilization protein EutH n=1 Tax=Neisseria sp. Ec49-e6-T10 TaxID=3140744 RepID=UPI003EB6D9CD
MSIDEVIVWVMMIFMAVAAFDRVLDQFGGAEAVLGKVGLGVIGRSFEGAGKQFEEGFMAMGALGLAMVGMMAFAPVLASLLQGILAPIYNALGANPAMFAGTVLAIDMGGYPLAGKLSNGDMAATMYSGILLASMMGATIVFSIPVGLGIIRKQDQRFMATGILAGMVAIPLGCILGGLTAMALGVTIDGQPVDFSISMLLKNMIPVFLFAILIVVGLKIAQEGMIKGFQVFAKCLVALITLALASSVIEALTGTVIIPGMDPIFSHGKGEFTSAIETIGSIACVLLGAYPMVFLLTRWFEKPLMVFGRLLKMNESSVAGMIATLANNIPMFGMMSKMDDRGKVLNVAFSVCAAFALGDHLGFVAGVDGGAASAMITPMIVGKIGGGIIAIFIAMFFAPKATAGAANEVTATEETAAE